MKKKKNTSSKNVVLPPISQEHSNLKRTMTRLDLPEHSFDNITSPNHKKYAVQVRKLTDDCQTSSQETSRIPINKVLASTVDNRVTTVVSPNQLVTPEPPESTKVLKIDKLFLKPNTAVINNFIETKQPESNKNVEEPDHAICNGVVASVILLVFF